MTIVHMALASLMVIVTVLGSFSAAVASGGSRRAQTDADYTPFERFEPLAASATCVPGGNQTQPFRVPPGYRQDIVAVENFAADRTRDLWDMNTHNESGKDAGRYLYRTHEVGAGTTTDPRTDPNGSQVSVVDLETGDVTILAERPDWERFDGIVWTPWGTILAAEETRVAQARDLQVPQATAGLVCEFFVDADDPTRLDPSRERITLGDGTNDNVRDGVRARPALGSKSHEGMRFDKQGNHYGISEVNGGAIYRFQPSRRNDLARGRLQALKTPNGRTGQGVWVNLDDRAVQVDADAEAQRVGANGYERPEDVETTTSTGKDRNNGGNTLYVAVTGAGFNQTGTPGNVFAVDLSSRQRPFIYAYAGPEAGNATFPDFQSPDNLALDAKGNLAISEDPGGVFPVKSAGDDVWIAAPPRSDDDDDDDSQDDGKRRRPALTVQRFASLTDCDAEPT
ncbi:MAG: alkaline phosphatase PhoX, partial [Chloroflexia bacterium]